MGSFGMDGEEFEVIISQMFAKEIMLLDTAHG
jgi:hypothetical protein